MTQIADRNIVVTGGASGIGRLLVRDLAALGGRVALWDLDETGARAAAKELGGDDRVVHPVRCDVGDPEDVARAAERTRELLGDVDIVVNNAGVVSGRPMHELTTEQVERTFRVNTLALFWVTNAFLPQMIERDSGHVVTIASAAGFIGVTRQADYSASKHAAVGMMESLRMELRHTAPHVRTTVVCPFYIDTGMFEGVRTRFPALLPILKPEPVVRQIVKGIQRDRQRLLIPASVHSIAITRLLPLGAFDAIADFLGVNHSMDSFVGRGEQARARGRKKAAAKAE